MRFFQISIVCLFLLCLPVMAQQQFPGIWEGTLKFNNVEMRIVFRIFDDVDSLRALLDSPDQGAKDIPVNSVTVQNNSIRMNVDIIKGYFEGILIKDSIDGKWVQGGMTLPLVLHKVDKVEEARRPQTPEGPFPYKEEEVVFENAKAGIELAGTFTYPEGKKNYPAVILVSGSGPQDRDETIFNHKPFLVIADYLTRNGIAVLRYDDRGIGKSTGSFTTGTSLDFSYDAESAVNYLLTRDDIDKKNIGIIGHSEGGMIAPMVSNRNKDVDFIVLLAGPGLKGDELLLLQLELISRAEGVSEDEISKSKAAASEIYKAMNTQSDTALLKQEIIKILKDSFDSMSDEEKKSIPDVDAVINQQVAQTMSSWFRYFITYDPYPEFTKVGVPVLAVIGEKDLQVPAKQNLAAIEKALEEGGRKDYKLVELPGLNHLFQTSKTGSVSEYQKIEETFSESALSLISEWILQISEAK